MAISHVNAGPDYFSISGILITIALMCLSLIFLAHKAKLSVIARSSEAFPSISAGNAPLMMHDEARGEAGTVLTSSPILQPGMDNSPTLESSQSLSRTLSQSPKPSSSAVVRLYLPHMGNNNNKFFGFGNVRPLRPRKPQSHLPKFRNRDSPARHYDFRESTRERELMLRIPSVRKEFPVEEFQ